MQARAARQLGFARERFEALSHGVGLARVRWIDEHLFDGSAAAAATGDAAALAAVFRPRKRVQTFTQFASDPKSPVAIRLAWAVSTGDEPLIRSIVESAPAGDLTSFCALPDTAPPDTVLDLGDALEEEPTS